MLLIVFAGFGWVFSGFGSGALRASAATDPVIAAAGDIACDPANSSFNGGLGTSSNCRQKYTYNLLVNINPAAVLDLGDNQYYCGGYQAFLRSYDLSWGQLKAITRPSIGNHEYLTSGGTGCDISNEGAAGYFNYFGAAAGTAGKGWYSYNVGAWHIIALNSNCTDINGCGPGSAEYTWLQNDLAAHPVMCTLAYWHIPLFSSGGRAASNSQALWQILYNYQADVILNGHDHIYERFKPMDPTGAVNLARGLREFIVGTGGADHTGIAAIAANSELRNADTYGVLKLTLHAGSYDWQFVPEAGKTFTDSGTGACHDNVPDTTPPSAPGGLTATNVAYNRVSLSWGLSKDDVGVSGYRIYRNGAQIASTSSRTYSDTGVQPQTTYSYFVTAFDAAGNVSAPSNALGVTTPSAASAFLFTPTDDTYVQSDQPGTNFGSFTDTVVDASPTRRMLLKFVVSGLAQPVASAKLRLYCVNGSPLGGEFHHVANSSWTQGTVTWNSAPALDAALLGSLGSVAPGAWYEVDVTQLVTGNGTYSIGGLSSSADGAYYSTREGSAGFAPQLVVSVNTSGTATATPTSTPTSTPTATGGTPLFSDGFESGTLSKWSSGQGLVVQSQQVASGSFAARGTTAGGGPTYVRQSLATAQTDLYYRIRFKVLSVGANTVNLMKLRSAADGPILSLSVSSAGMLAYRNDVTGASVNSATPVAPGAWQTLQVHVVIAGAGSQVQLWYNEAPVSALTRSESLGTNPVGRLQLGENTPGLTYDLAFDDVTAALSYIGSAPTPTPTNTPTVTPMTGLTAAPTATATPVTGQSITVWPEADTFVNAGQPAVNFGGTANLRADASPDMHGYLRFTVAGLNGASIQRVRLLFYITSGSRSVLNALSVADNSWDEKQVTYQAAPAMGGFLAASGKLTEGTWVTLDLTGYVTGEGVYSFGMITPGTSAVSFSAREAGANAPRLIIDLAP